LRANRAAGELYLALSAEQRTYIEAVQDDPAMIWSTLASIHLQQHPGARFNAWDNFFSIRMLKLVIVHFVFALLSSFIFALLPSNQVWLIVYSCFILFVLFVHLCCVPSVLYSLVIDTGHKCSGDSHIFTGYEPHRLKLLQSFGYYCHHWTASFCVPQITGCYSITTFASKVHNSPPNHSHSLHSCLPTLPCLSIIVKAPSDLSNSPPPTTLHGVEKSRPIFELKAFGDWL